MSYQKRKRALDENEAQEEDDSVGQLQAPSSNRRRLKATLRSPSMAPGAVSTISSPPFENGTPTRNRTESHDSIQSPPFDASTSSSPGTGSVRMRKSKRQRKLLEERYNLNREVALWAQGMEKELLRRIETSQWTEGNKDGHTNDITRCIGKGVQKYTQHMEDINRYVQAPSSTEVLTFGSGDCGQLGLTENMPDLNRPTFIRSLHNCNVKSIACGGLHNAVVLGNGKVETWGCNDEGSLGKTSVDTAFVPLGVDGFVPGKVEVANGLTKITTWSDVKEKLGGDTAIDLSDPNRSLNVEQERMVKATAGDVQTLILSENGRVYMFGAYKDTEGKSFSDEAPADDPRLHPKENKRFTGKLCVLGTQPWPIHCWQMPGKALDIDCGCSFNAAIVEMKSTKVCVTWGIGQKGELSRPVQDPIKDVETLGPRGDDDPWWNEYHVDKVRKEHLVPKPVVFAETPPMNRSVESICCGGYHLMLTAKDGGGSMMVYSSGLNNYGQLGLGHTTDVENLSRVTFFDNCNITKLAAGIHHSLALDGTGKKLYAFGRGDSGQLGLTSQQTEAGYFEASPKPLSLCDGKENSTISTISCGGNHNFALTNEGEVYSWGYGDNGALGHGRDQDENKPRLLDLMKFENKKKKDALIHKLTAKVELLEGGGQHSAIAVRVSSSSQDQ